MSSFFLSLFSLENRIAAGGRWQLEINIFIFKLHYFLLRYYTPETVSFRENRKSQAPIKMPIKCLFLQIFMMMSKSILNGNLLHYYIRICLLILNKRCVLNIQRNDTHVDDIQRWRIENDINTNTAKNENIFQFEFKRSNKIHCQ